MTRGSQANSDLPFDEQVEQSGLRTLGRGFAILEVLAAAPLETGMTHAELSRQLDLHRSTLYRYLASLIDLGLVEPTTEDPEAAGARYRLGPRLFGLAKRASRERAFPTYAEEFVNRLGAATGETAHAARYHQGNSVTIALSDPAGPLGWRVPVGSMRPAHSSASGKVFLAFADPGLLRAYLTRPLARSSMNTITEQRELLGTLQKVRMSGFALDQSECVDGVSCAAAPVFNARGAVVGTLSISIESEALSDGDVDGLVTPLLDSTKAMTQKLSSQRPGGSRQPRAQ